LATKLHPIYKVTSVHLDGDFAFDLHIKLYHKIQINEIAVPVLKYCALMTYRIVRIKFHAFLTSEFNGSETKSVLGKE
jgi:hypothetical protein